MKKIRRGVYSPEEKATVIKKYMRGQTLGQIGLALGRHPSTIWHFIAALKEDGDIPAVQPERPKKAPPPLPPIKIGSFEEPLAYDPRERDFLDALAASESHPAQARVREGRAVAPRLSAPLSVSCVGSPAMTCSEN